MHKRIRVLGGGWYGTHLTLALIRAGYVPRLHEIAAHLFAGASGANPARLHDGFHYPRSSVTRNACWSHRARFIDEYGHLTRPVLANIYAVAARDSLLDFGSYHRVLSVLPCMEIESPAEWGLTNVEGALLTQERHIVIREARKYFTDRLEKLVEFNHSRSRVIDSQDWDMTIDCTFCANDAENVERFEPCMTVIMEGPTDRAVTIMDGPFPSLYPWDEQNRECSLTSAKLTPLGRFATHAEAQDVLTQLDADTANKRAAEMVDQMAFYFPQIRTEYRRKGYLLSIRAMPRSGSDARLVDVVRVGKRAIRVRAGKIDAIFEAERIVLEMLGHS